MNLLIFDYDGVIVDSLKIFMENFILACKKEGVNEIANKRDFWNCSREICMIAWQERACPERKYFILYMQ